MRRWARVNARGPGGLPGPRRWGRLRERDDDDRAVRGIRLQQPLALLVEVEVGGGLETHVLQENLRVLAVAIHLPDPAIVEAGYVDGAVVALREAVSGAKPGGDDGLLVGPQIDVHDVAVEELRAQQMPVRVGFGDAV